MNDRAAIASVRTAASAPVWAGVSGLIFGISLIGLLGVIYGNLLVRMYNDWGMADSYYSHGYLVLPICLLIIWMKRREFFAAPVSAAPIGYVLILGSMVVLVLQVFLGFAIFGQLTLGPMLIGLCLVFMGVERMKVIWFPIAFMYTMIPIPSSITQGMTFNLKLFAAEVAVKLTQLVGYPMIREGSYIHFGDDTLLVGDVCGGLRSLIALVATGMLVSYFSKTNRVGQWTVLLMSAPIAIAANIARIFMVCIVAYYWGSEFAAGKFHDISGLLIFAVAFVLFFMLEALLRKWLPAAKASPGETA